MLALIIGVWRGVIALEHFRASIAVVNDPSMRELEQVSALFNIAAALLAFLHAAVAFVLSRRHVAVNMKLLLAVALFCGMWVAAALFDLAMLSVTGVYPAGIVLGVFLLSSFAQFSWLSIYLGVIMGGTAAWVAAIPESGILACIFVVLPCAVYALIGGLCSYMLVHRRAAGRAC